MYFLAAGLCVPRPVHEHRAPERTLEAHTLHGDGGICALSGPRPRISVPMGTVQKMQQGEPEARNDSK